jgi:fructose 1,6-bisphosphatase
MKNVISILIISVVLASCGSQKTITLANGKVVSESKLDRMTNKAFRHANRVARKESGYKFEEVFEGTEFKVTVDTTTVK